MTAHGDASTTAWPERSASSRRGAKKTNTAPEVYRKSKRENERAVGNPLIRRRKKITGRKRNIDTLGLLLAVTVTIASVDGAYAACPVMQQLTESRQPRLQIA